MSEGKAPVVFTYPYCRYAGHAVKVFIVNPVFSEDGSQIVSAEKYWCSFRSHCAHDPGHEHECPHAQEPSGNEDPLEPCLSFPINVADLVLAEITELESA
ncbi:MAG: hypothetical protein ACP5R4_08390 [Armatimonadota bacterium]